MQMLVLVSQFERLFQLSAPLIAGLGLVDNLAVFRLLTDLIANSNRLQIQTVTPFPSYPVLRCLPLDLVHPVLI